MIAILCASLSGLAFFASTGLGVIWPLAFVAAGPVLWLAFGPTRGRVVALAAFAAFAIGRTNLLPATHDILSVTALAAAILKPSLLFALVVLAARRIQRRLGDMAAMLAFAALWTGVEFLFGYSSLDLSLGPALAAVPMLAQSASLFGQWSLTFLLCIVPAGIALFYRTGAMLPLALSLGLFFANALFGALRPTDDANTIRVGLVVAEDLKGKDNNAIATADAYSTLIGSIAERAPALIILPEHIIRLEPPVRATALTKLSEAAKNAHATVIVGVEDMSPGGGRNLALVFAADGDASQTYLKRTGAGNAHPGTASLVLGNGAALTIGEDAELAQSLRADVTSATRLLAVSAADNEEDAADRARIAILRGIENGVAVARVASHGLLTLNDRYGRLVNRRTSTGDAPMTLVGDLPVPLKGGQTLYNRMGDVFAWIALLAGVALFLRSFKRTKGR